MVGSDGISFACLFYVYNSAAPVLLSTYIFEFHRRLRAIRRLSEKIE